jgi:hypothetical protein
MASLEEVVADLLDAGVGPLTLGTNLFTGPMREVSEGVPHRCVFVFPVGGPPAIRFMGPTPSTRIRQPDVQIRVRSEPDKFSAGLQLARLCRDAADRKLNESGFMSILVNDSEPAWFRQQENGSWLFTLTVNGQQETSV